MTSLTDTDHINRNNNTDTSSQDTINTNDETIPTLTDDEFNALFTLVNEVAAQSSGRGSNNFHLQNILTRLDRYKSSIFPWHYELSGATFITRPRLNLSGANLKMHPILATLASNKADSISFMIRALLDTYLSQDYENIGHPHMPDTEERQEFAALVAQSPLIDSRSPFLTPLCNALTDISGFADFILETETTSGGFFSEDMTYAKGSDMNYRSTELSLGFREIYGGVVLAILYVWVLYMALQCKGQVMAYASDIYEQRINYGVSIYRFTFDATGEVLTGWAKATGCYPRSIPIGAKFNISEGEVYSSSAARFSVPFIANKIEYMHPNILTDFNRLVKRYCSNIESMIQADTPTISDNMLGIPYIVETHRGLELKYFYEESERQFDVSDLSTIFGE